MSRSQFWGSWVACVPRWRCMRAFWKASPVISEWKVYRTAIIILRWVLLIRFVRFSIYIREQSVSFWGSDAGIVTEWNDERSKSRDKARFGYALQGGGRWNQIMAVCTREKRKDDKTSTERAARAEAKLVWIMPSRKWGRSIQPRLLILLTVEIYRTHL